MTSFAELSAEEQARQLRDPDGETGMATADALAAVNRAGNVFLITSLGLAPSDVVLEVGCGLATMAADVVAAADGIEYVGLNRSATMIEAARERHRDLIGAGRASFRLASTERVPFPDGRLSKVFSTGVHPFLARSGDPAGRVATRDAAGRHYVDGVPVRRGRPAVRQGKVRLPFARAGQMGRSRPTCWL